MDLSKQHSGAAAANGQAQIAAEAGKPLRPFVFRLNDIPPNRETKGGTVRIADSTNFLASKAIAAAQIRIRSGSTREMHWHPNADERLHILNGTRRATVFNTGPAAIIANFRAGDIGYVKKGLGHYLENTGNTDLLYMEVFRADRFEEVSLSDWPIDMVAETLNLDPSVIAQFPKHRRRCPGVIVLGLVPGAFRLFKVPWRRSNRPHTGDTFSFKSTTVQPTPQVPHCSPHIQHQTREEPACLRRLILRVLS